MRFFLESSSSRSDFKTMDQNGLQSATFLSITMDMEDYKSSCSTRFDFLLSHLGPK